MEEPATWIVAVECWLPKLLGSCQEGNDPANDCAGLCLHSFWKHVCSGALDTFGQRERNTFSPVDLGCNVRALERPPSNN